MKNESLARAGEQVKANVAEIAEKAKDITVRVKAQCEETCNDIERGVRRAKLAAEDGIADVRRGIRKSPFITVTSVAAGAFGIGLLTGWLIGRRNE
ncbi:MAG TPA: hypothetical protein VFI72_11415 [Candidatus Angelobacter sp.]|nr:hypothetical protein [Candidatus Angelobacter sp.]